MSEIGTMLLWPDEYENNDLLVGKSDAELCAIGMMGWANMSAGSKPTIKIIRTIARIGEMLGIDTPNWDGFKEWADKRKQGEQA